VRTVEDIVAAAARERTSILAVDLSGDEWRNFDVNVRLYASVNVTILYSVWKRALSEWTIAGRHPERRETVRSRTK
jgi:hypothetical protein